MSREILFKAKRKDNGKWVEGCLIIDYVSGQYFIHQNGNSVNESQKIGEEGCLRFLVFEIDPDTLSQYTGLTDKNGNKIWENDICDRKEKYPEIVVFNKGDWQLDYSYVFGKEIHTDACNLGFYACERKCVEVIGNIFDNADLLEVKE